MPSEWRRSLSVDTRCSGGPSGLRPPDEPAPPCSIDHVGHGHDAGGAHPDHEFARHAVAPPVLLGVLRSHVAAPDHRRPVGDLLQILLHGGDSLDGHEGERVAGRRLRTGPPAGRGAGSYPSKNRRVMSRDIADRRTYAGYVTFAFGARGW